MPQAAFALFFAALVAVSRNNHPTLVLNIIASGIMTLASAIAFALTWPLRLSSAIHFVTIALFCLVGGVASAILVSEVYDTLWGPDPLRFGFLENIGMDTAVVLAGWLWARLLTRSVPVR